MAVMENPAQDSADEAGVAASVDSAQSVSARVLALRATWASDAAILAHHMATRAGECSGLVVLDLAPGDGERGWQLLRLLSAETPITYIACCDGEQEVRALRSHATLAAHLAAGRYRVVPRPLTQAAWEYLIGDGDAAVAILAHDTFGAMHHALYACHYGEWLRARPMFMPDGAVQVEWRGEESTASEVGRLADVYLAGLNSAAVLLPTGATACLAPLLAAAEGRWLLVSSERGTANLAEIRLGALAATPAEVFAGAPQPVNYHAMEHWLRQSGAACGSTVEPGTGIVWQIAHCEPGEAATETGLRALQAEAAKGWRTRGLPGVAQALTAQLDGAQAFALWQAAEWAPAMLATFEAQLVSAAGRLEAEALPIWREALAAACDQHFPPRVDDGFLFAAARLAANLDAWRTAQALIEQANRHYGTSADALRLLAHCQHMRGDSAGALASVELAVLEFGEQPALCEDRAALRACLARWRSLAWYDESIADETMLCLRPLGPEHAAAFRYQYRDPQICMMTRLPAFADDNELHAWMAERADEAGRMDLAIIHRASGFAGVVSAHRIDDCAFFHFWIGADFQGQGLAAPAIRLLCAQLVRLGVRRVFTTAYPDNLRSQRALRRAGFVELDIRALPPEDGMPFFCLDLAAQGDDLSDGDHASALRDYCARSGGVFQFAPHALDVNDMQNAVAAA